MSRPDSFSNELERWVYRKSVASIVCLELRPNQEAVYKQLRELHPIDVHAQDFAVKDAELRQESERNMYATGFVVEPVMPDPARIFILTCAHVIGRVFNVNQPIQADQIDDLYQSFVVCDHRERAYQEGEEPDGQRHFTRGTARLISLANDLLLIQVTSVHMLHYCPEPHPPLLPAARFPGPLKKVVLISWPTPNRNRTAVTGETSHTGRPFDQLNDENPFGFTTLLSEVNIPSEKGASGAPLLNGNAEFAGVLHAGNGKMSYFISFGDLIDTLTEWGMRIL